MEEPKYREEHDETKVPFGETVFSFVVSENDSHQFSDRIQNMQESVIINNKEAQLENSSEISLEISAITTNVPNLPSDSYPTIAAGPHQAPNCSPNETTEKLQTKNQSRLTLDICDINSNCVDQPSLYSAPKSPVTVQDWVDSIDLSNESKTELDVTEGGPCTKDITGVSRDLEEDNLRLGAEALHLRQLKKDEPKSNNIRSDSLRKAFKSDRENSQSLNSETSAISISSVEAFLETMRDDPEEILVNLGFGSPGSSPLARIPKRFLVPSQVKGNDLHEFIEKHEEMQELFDMGFSGYRGLSGICMDGHSPSGIVSKILEKIRDRNNELKRALTMNSSANTSVIATHQPPTMSFFHAAFSVMAANAFRNAIRPDSSNNSILEPENRQFLDSQDEMVSNRRKKKPRLVIGKHSFTVDTDEELIDDSDDVRKKNKKGHPPPPQSSEVPDGVSDTLQHQDTTEKQVKNLGRPPLGHSMSDEVFLPAENKTRHWDVVRITKKSSLSRSCDIEDDDRLRAATVESTPQIALDLVNTLESTSENEKATKVAMGQCHSNRLNRLTRQISIHEEVQEKSVSSDQQQQQLKMRLKLDSMKSGYNKDSFELEELPPTAGDFQDDDWQGNLDRKGLQTDSSDIPRTGSAMSDSSGFLDGETLETVMDIIDEVSVHVTSIDTQIQALVIEESGEDTPTLTAITSEITEDEALRTCATFSSTETEDNVETTWIQGKVDCDEQLESNKQSVVEVSDSSLIFICDQIGYLSESDTIVAIDSSSSGDTQPTSIKKKSITGFEPPNVRKTHDSPTTSLESTRQPCANLPLDTTLAKSRSEANLNMVYTSPMSRYQRMGTSSSWTSLDNISSCRISWKTDLPQVSSRVGSDTNPGNWYGSSPHIPRHLRDVSGFHKSCTLAIERMRDVLKLYTKQLNDMERSCWETHNRFFPGMTKEERDELKRLSDLRRHILEEANRTQLLLSSKAQCEQRDYAIQSSYGTRHEPTSLVLEEEEPNQVKQMFEQMKREILQEVKTILQSDHLRFQEELQKTRSGIEQVQQTVNQLLSIIKSVKTS